jgi:hypothetical protein
VQSAEGRKQKAESREAEGGEQRGRRQNVESRA